MKSREEKPKHEEKLKDDRSELGEKETGEEEEKVKETLPASWLKPIKWFMGQFVKDSGKYSPRGVVIYCIFYPQVLFTTRFLHIPFL